MLHTVLRLLLRLVGCVFLSQDEPAEHSRRPCLRSGSSLPPTFPSCPPQKGMTRRSGGRCVCVGCPPEQTDLSGHSTHSHSTWCTPQRRLQSAPGTSHFFGWDRSSRVKTIGGRATLKSAPFIPSERLKPTAVQHFGQRLFGFSNPLHSPQLELAAFVPVGQLGH